MNKVYIIRADGGPILSLANIVCVASKPEVAKDIVRRRTEGKYVIWEEHDSHGKTWESRIEGVQEVWYIEEFEVFNF